MPPDTDTIKSFVSLSWRIARPRRALPSSRPWWTNGGKSLPNNRAPQKVRCSSPITVARSRARGPSELLKRAVA
ncbi:hypothetical protein IQ62_22710 [Streptomyces scabiei]|nr:hypothetical protein IQ62_22710 [Streptomyces scabiei]